MLNKKRPKTMEENKNDQLVPTENQTDQKEKQKVNQQNPNGTPKKTTMTEEEEEEERDREEREKEEGPQGNDRKDEEEEEKPVKTPLGQNGLKDKPDQNKNGKVNTMKTDDKTRK
jgi:hypothetical protein